MRGFPVDFLSFLFKVPGCDAIVFNQVIEIPNQVATLRKLEQKKKTAFRYSRPGQPFVCGGY